MPQHANGSGGGVPLFATAPIVAAVVAMRTEAVMQADQRAERLVVAFCRLWRAG
jgi:hypothetical protein